MDPISLGLMGGGLLLSGIGSLFGRGKARRDARNAERAINSYDRFDPVNAYQDLPISTLGSDILREEAGRTTATLTDAAIAGGSRGVFSALPQIMGASQQASREAALMMDQQMQSKAQMIAGDNVRIQNEYLQRDRENLAGLGAQLNVARQQEADYTRALINLPMAAGSMLGGAFGQGGGTATTPTINSRPDMSQFAVTPGALSALQSPWLNPLGSLPQPKGLTFTPPKYPI